MGTPPVTENTLLSAALRHLRDAEHLAEPAGAHLSLDQAYHLAGFGPECARKAAIAAPWADKPLGHDLSDDAEAVLDLAVAIEPAAARYALWGWEKEYTALAAWDPQCRYKRTGAHERALVEPLLREAQLAVAEIMAALWADGRLSIEALR
jgi:hypothetical protein